MSRRTFSELQIPSTLPAGITSDLCGTHFHSEQLYRLRLPSNSSSGRLMRLNGGELDGLLTTTLIGAKGIEGVAGLVPVSVSSISPLIILRHLHAISACIASLTGDLGRLQRDWQEKFDAEVESAISDLADIASRVDEAVLNESYRTALLVDVRRIKGQLGRCFEQELKEFDRYISGMCDELRKSRNYSNAPINNISYLGRCKIFSILGFLSVCELFEIVLYGTFSENMMRASLKTLTAKRSKIFAVTNKYYDCLVSHLEHLDNENSWRDAGRAWHLARMDEHSANLGKARYEFDKLESPHALLDAFLSGDATRVEEFWFIVRDDRIDISTGYPIEYPSDKLLSNKD